MLHVDPETGVKGHFWTEPIEVTFDNWDYTTRQWRLNKQKAHSSEGALRRFREIILRTV